VIRIGDRALAALRRSRGRAEVLAPLSRSTYFLAAGRLIWLGVPGQPLHPRAILSDALPAPESLAALAPWKPRQPRRTDGLREAAKRLRPRLATLGPPRGLGALLFGKRPAFPLHQAGAALRALPRSAPALLGLGPGLTPSGDDAVGGFLFARRLLGRKPPRRLLALARRRTTRISAVLLADHAMGRSFEPLHELALALAEGREDAALAAARRLVAIGHSSGWDMLTGFMRGVGAWGR